MSRQGDYHHTHLSFHQNRLPILNHVHLLSIHASTDL